MNESDRTSALAKLLRALPGSMWWKNHATEFSERGLPDLMGVMNGTFFAFEVKVGKNWLTEQQMEKLSRLSASGAVAGVIHIGDGYSFVTAADAKSKQRGKCVFHKFQITESELHFLGSL